MELALHRQLLLHPNRLLLGDAITRTYPAAKSRRTSLYHPVKALEPVASNESLTASGLECGERLRCPDYDRKAVWCGTIGRAVALQPSRGGFNFSVSEQRSQSNEKGSPGRCLPFRKSACGELNGEWEDGLDWE